MQAQETFLYRVLLNLKMNVFLKKYLKEQLVSMQISLLESYVEELVKWNRVYNLTAITDPKEIVIKHILDSLAIKDYLKGNRILDVGTGAGFPGIPLAIIFSEKRFTLLDSNSKKTRFLLNVIGKLSLKNVEIVHHRVETYQSPNCFDTIVTRAFSDIASFLNSTQQLICDQGVFLAMKGVYPKKELEKLPEGFQTEKVISLNIPDLDAERHLVIVRKDTSNLSL